MGHWKVIKSQWGEGDWNSVRDIGDQWSSVVLTGAEWELF